MTFDPKTGNTLNTLAGNNTCVLMMSLCYVICGRKYFLNIFDIFDPCDPIRARDPKVNANSITSHPINILTKFEKYPMNYVAVETFLVKMTF